MEHYELLAIVSSKVLENEVDGILEKIKAEITVEKGKITLTKNLGKKKFSYPLAQMRYGYYLMLEFNLDQSRVKSLDKKLSQEGSIIRQQIIKVREKTAEEIKNLAQERLEKPVPAKRKIVTPIPSRPPQIKEPAQVEEVATTASFKTPTPSQATSFLEPTPKKPKQKEEKKITLEELDEKLDKILQDDIMNE